MEQSFLRSTVGPRVKCESHSRVRLFASPGTAAHQVPLSMGFSRQGYWSGLLFPFPGDPPNPGIKPGSPALQADSLPTEPAGKPSEGAKGDELGLTETHTLYQKDGKDLPCRTGNSPQYSGLGLYRKRI